jgi:hypothetical protein
MSELSPLPGDVLPAGIRARFVSGVNGLRMHVLEAGSAAPGRPAVLLLHGFPERWLPDDELAVYTGEYRRHGFQGGLNWYRSRSGGAFESELQLFSGRTTCAEAGATEGPVGRRTGRQHSDQASSSTYTTPSRRSAAISASPRPSSRP